MKSGDGSFGRPNSVSANTFTHEDAFFSFFLRGQRPINNNEDQGTLAHSAKRNVAASLALGWLHAMGRSLTSNQK